MPIYEEKRKMNSKVLVWLDLETTGLDPINDSILEVGIILTDWDLNEITRQNWIIHREEVEFKKMTSFVQRMHTDNGLWEECRASPLSVKVAEVDIMRFLEPYLEKATLFILGGNSVHFDRSFIETNMRLLSTLLHHRIVDISSISLIIEKWAPEKFEQTRKTIKEKLKSMALKEHRTLSDLVRCLEYARMYKDLIFKPQVPLKENDSMEDHSLTRKNVS